MPTFRRRSRGLGLWTCNFVDLLSCCAARSGRWAEGQRQSRRARPHRARHGPHHRRPDRLGHRVARPLVLTRLPLASTRPVSCVETMHERAVRGRHQRGQANKINSAGRETSQGREPRSVCRRAPTAPPTPHIRAPLAGLRRRERCREGFAVHHRRASPFAHRTTDDVGARVHLLHRIRRPLAAL